MADILSEALGELTQEELSALSGKQQQIINICLLNLKNFQNVLQKNGMLLEAFNNSVITQLQNTQINKNNQEIFKSVQQTSLYEKLMDIKTDTYAIELAQEGYKTLTLVGEQLRGLKEGTPQEIKYSIFYTSQETNTTLKSNTVNLQEYLNMWSNINENGLITLKTNLNQFTEVHKDIQQRWKDIKQILIDTRQQLANDIINAQTDEKLMSILNSPNLKFSEEQKELIRLFKQDKTKFFEFKNISADKQKSSYWQSKSGFIKNIIYAKYNLGRGVELAYSDKNISGNSIINEIQKMLSENRKFYEGPDFSTNKIIEGQIIQVQAKMRNATINLASITNGIVELTSRFVKLRQELKIFAQKGSAKVKIDSTGAEEKAYSLVEKELMAMFNA